MITIPLPHIIFSDMLTANAIVMSRYLFSVGGNRSNTGEMLINGEKYIE